MEEKLIWVRGNSQPLLIPLEQEIVNSDGTVTEPYYPEGDASVAVYLVGRSRKYMFKPTVDGNLLTITENGSVPAGCYGIEVIVINLDGSRFRSFWPEQVVVTESNHSVLEQWNEFRNTGVRARAALFFFAKGDAGVSNIIAGTGSNSIVQKGGGNSATGNNSSAFGQETVAIGNEACSYGDSTVASGNNSHAEGHFSEASGNSSHAEGKRTEASEDYAHAEGEGSKASGIRSHAEGNNTVASGADSHAEGATTIASGDSAHAGGTFANASGDNSFAHGESVEAKNDNEVAFGAYNVSRTGETAAGKTVFSVGIGELGAGRNAMEIREDGTMFLANGNDLINVQEALAKTAYQLINAEVTQNSETGKYEFVQAQFGNCQDAWNAGKIPVLRLIDADAGQQIVVLAFVPMFPSGASSITEFKGSVPKDADSYYYVYVGGLQNASNSHVKVYGILHEVSIAPAPAPAESDSYDFEEDDTDTFDFE